MPGDSLSRLRHVPCCACAAQPERTTALEALGGGEAFETEVSESNGSNLDAAYAAFSAISPGTCPDGQSVVKDRSR